MANYRSLAIGAVIFAFLSYFLLLPLIASGVEAFKNMIISYCLKLFHKLTVVGVVLAGTTTLYLGQSAIRKLDTESVKKKLQSLWPKSLTFRKKTTAEDDKADDTAYPLRKVFLIASEMLSTEESYVNELHIIEEMFHTRVESENLLKEEVLNSMFANIRSMYRFHKQDLLPSLQDRMKKWKEQKEKFSQEHSVDNEWPDQKIGDIFVKQAPFLKMYSDYIENFDNAMNTIDKHKKKNKKFAAIMQEIQLLPELNRLSLQHHMLSPVQRIPRYKLLLEDYIKRLPENSSDLENAKKGLALVEEAASHSNDTMKRIERLKKIMDVQELLGGTIDLSSPTREFVKEGKVSKTSASKGGDTLKDTLIKDTDRYIFLFNDVLLLCSTNSLTKRVRGGAKYKLKMKFEFDSLVIKDTISDNDENEKAFSLSHTSSHNTAKSKVDLSARTTSEKDEWIQSITKALKSFEEKKAELRSTSSTDQESCDSKLSLEEKKSTPVFQLNSHDMENDSDAMVFDIHEEGDGKDADHSDTENDVPLRSSERSPKSRYSVKSLSMGRSKSPMDRMKKKNSVLF